MSSTIIISTQTTINQPIAKVWECWTKPEHIVHWNFASADWHCPTAENDFRTGGKFNYQMAARDGSFSFDFWGIYSEIKEFKSIYSTLGDGRKMWIDFREDGAATHIDERFEAETENTVELQQMGWQAILDNFKKYCETK